MDYFHSKWLACHTLILYMDYLHSLWTIYTLFLYSVCDNYLGPGYAWVKPIHKL